jgi:hypothetical protein
VLRIRDVYPRSQILIFSHPGSRIPDPKTATKERGSHKFHKIANYFSFELLKKKIWANFQRIIELLNQNCPISSQKYEVEIQDPRSGIRKKPIPDPGSRGPKGTGSRIRNTGIYCE